MKLFIVCMHSFVFQLYWLGSHGLALKNKLDSIRPQAFSTGWGVNQQLGWPSLTGASTTGFGSLSANQDTTASQVISFQASGQGMNINFNSSLGGDSGAVLLQNGSQAAIPDLSEGGIIAVIDDTVASTYISPGSTIDLDVTNADTVNVEIDSQALGGEQVDSEVGQQVDTISLQTSLPGWRSDRVGEN